MRTTRKIAEKVRKAIPGRDQNSSVPTIYVAPRDLVEGTIDPYEPEVVCIGALFNQTEREKTPRGKMESYKWCCLRKLLVNAQIDGREAEDDAWIPGVHEPLLGECLDTVRKLLPRILESYGDISVDSMDTLTLMMLLDASFLLHLLMMVGQEKGGVDDDFSNQTIGRCGILRIVARDLLLLKNQISFFVLQKLLEQLRMNRDSDSKGNLVKWGLRLFSEYHRGPAGYSEVDASGDVHHLLHLYHISIVGKLKPPGPVVPSPTIFSCPLFCISIACTNNNLTTEQGQGTKSSRRGLPWVPCAKELEEAGITFRAKKPKKSAQIRSFLDVRFSHGVLEIPQLELYDSSEAHFRNLIAFEQTYLCSTGGHVTAYAMFMECLIKTPEDMRLLHHSGVLKNHMSGGDRDAVATGFFSKVCAQTYSSWKQNHLAHVTEVVVNYQSTKWRRWRAMLKRNYFSNPWVTTSVVAAFILLVMAALQAFFVVYDHYKSHTCKKT